MPRPSSGSPRAAVLLSRPWVSLQPHQVVDTRAFLAQVAGVPRALRFLAKLHKLSVGGRCESELNQLGCYLTFVSAS